jgi:hypothetical protein
MAFLFLTSFLCLLAGFIGAPVVSSYSFPEKGYPMPCNADLAIGDVWIFCRKKFPRMDLYVRGKLFFRSIGWGLRVSLRGRRIFAEAGGGSSV